MLLTIPVVVASLVVASPVNAEDKVIKTKLVTKVVSEGAGGYNCFGVTVQADGTIGSKDYFFKMLESGRFSGLSTYPFPDGSVTAQFNGETYGKGRDKGTYVIVSGTGAYAGAKGTGGFDGVRGFGRENPVQGHRRLRRDPERHPASPQQLERGHLAPCSAAPSPGGGSAGASRGSGAAGVPDLMARLIVSIIPCVPGSGGRWHPGRMCRRSRPRARSGK